MKTIKEFIVNEVKVKCGHLFKFEEPVVLVDKEDVLELIDEEIDKAKETLRENVTDNMKEFLEGLIRSYKKIKQKIKGKWDRKK